MKLKNLIWSPPGGWHYVQPESGHYMKGITFQSLLGKIITHRTNMGYPIVAEGFLDLSQEIEDAICKAMQPCDQVKLCQTGIRHTTAVHWSKVAAFLKSMATWFIGHGLAQVPQEEAERRAAICAKCPFNVPLSGCGLCRETLNGLRVAIFRASTSQDGKLQSCGVCGCDNKLQVHAPIEALRAGTGQFEYPKTFCWKAKGGDLETQL